MENKNPEANRPDVSLVIPTLNEAHSIADLINNLYHSFKREGLHPPEIIVVDDDSPDGTAKAALALSEEHPTLKVIKRFGEKGLATAVVRGWHEATGRYLAVIDGDLQHPPGIISQLYKATKEFKADLAIASRKVAGGGTLNWEFNRVIISETATYIAKFLLPVSLHKIQDATTGCFMLKRECVDLEKLDPMGFKIFLEVLVKGKFKNPVEVPYTFNQRSLGESKMSGRQNVLFLIHLIKLGVVKWEILIPLSIVIFLLFILF